MRLIAHISDVHFGRHDPGITDALLNQIHQMQPDLVVLSGLKEGELVTLESPAEAAKRAKKKL